MKRVLIGTCVLMMALSCNKLTAHANAGFTAFIEDIEVKPVQCMEYSIPEYSGFKSFMSYKLFGKKTEQYKLQQMALTDSKGFRRVDDYYVIAVGSYFNAKVGQRLDLVLENGEVIKCVVGDEKAEKDTDSSNIFSKNNCMSEFIVDIKTLETTVKSGGDVSLYPDEEWDSPVKEVILYEEFMEDLWESQG